MAKIKFRPLHDRVVVSASTPRRRPRAASSFPTPPRRSRRQGEIIAVGPGGRDESGKLIPIDLKAGDRVLFGKWSGTEVKIDGEELLIMKESDIMGVIDGHDRRQEEGRLNRPSPIDSIKHSKESNTWLPKTYDSPPTRATACCAASRSSPTP